MVATGGKSRRRALAGTVGAVLAMGLASACTSDGPEREAKLAAAPATVSITPENGTSKHRPDRGVVVTAGGGTLSQVAVKAGGKDVPGDFNADKTRWSSRWALPVGTEHTVHATATNADGTPAQAHSAFTTLKPAQVSAAKVDWILEANKGKTYGVGMPIILDFDRPVGNREQVERALQVTSEKPVEGAWRWINDERVVYRPKTYWQPHQKVTLNARLNGVRTAKNVYATKDLSRTFEIGASRITELDLKKHRMTVTVDGEQARKIKISGGNAHTREYTTTSGIHMTMEKDNPVRMVAPGRKKGDPGYYDLQVPYAVRVTNSGVYLHETVGEQWCLGERNCSHGCVRQPRKDAIWFYKNSQPGDIVDISGSRRKLEPTNGWGFWQLSWEDWRKGSALT